MGEEQTTDADRSVLLRRGTRPEILKMAPVVHALAAHGPEAGLRSGQGDDPYPQKVNRRCIARLAGLYFAPAERARQYPLREGIPARPSTEPSKPPACVTEGNGAWCERVFLGGIGLECVEPSNERAW